MKSFLFFPNLKKKKNQNSIFYLDFSFNGFDGQIKLY